MAQLTFNVDFHVKIEICNSRSLQKWRKYDENASSKSFYVELKNAIRCHYNELLTRCGVDTIYGYSILTDDCVNSIAPVANEERLIKVNKSTLYTIIIDTELLSGANGTILECLMK